jgi:hypothetical protein
MDAFTVNVCLDFLDIWRDSFRFPQKRPASPSSIIVIFETLAARTAVCGRIRKLSRTPRSHPLLRLLVVVPGRRRLLEPADANAATDIGAL